MKATYDNLEARFPAGPITPSNSSHDLEGQYTAGFSSYTPTISASSSSDYGTFNPIQTLEDPFIYPLPVKDQSVSERYGAPSSRYPARALKPTAVAPTTPKTPARKVTSSLATPPDTHHKNTSATVNTIRKRLDARSKITAAHESVSTSTSKSDLASKKPPTSRKSSSPQMTVPHKGPAKFYTPESLTRVRIAVSDPIANSESGDASPSVKAAGRVQTDPKIRKLPSTLVPSSLNLRAPSVNSPPTKATSSVKKNFSSNRTLVVAQKASAASIPSNKSGDRNHISPKRSTTLSAVHNVKVSPAKSSIMDPSEIQTVSKVSNLVTILPSGNPDETSAESISSELFSKVPMPYLLPIPGHSTPTRHQRPVSMSATPAAAGPISSNRTPLCSSSVTTSLCSTPEHACPPRVSFAEPVILSRSSPSFGYRSSASRTASSVTRVFSPANYLKVSGSSRVVPPAGASVTKSPLTTTIDIMKSGPPTLSSPANDNRDADSARRSNLMRMFRVRWTTGDDHLPFNVNTTGGLAGDDAQDEPHHEIDSGVKNDVKVLHRRPAVLDTLNAFLVGIFDLFSPRNNLMFLKWR